LLAATPASELLDFVARYADRWPEAGYAVLRHQLAAAGRRPGQGDGVAHLWFEHSLLVTQVERIAGRDRARELECYRSLLTAAYGSRLTRQDAAAFLEGAGDRAMPGLLAAALELAGDDRAQSLIRHELSERYLREEGYRSAAPASPVHRAPVLPSRDSSPYAPSSHPGTYHQPHPPRPGADSSYAQPSHPRSPAPPPVQDRSRFRELDVLNVAVVGGLLLIAIGVVAYIVLGGAP
jgi:hypothetical protein